MTNQCIGCCYYNAKEDICTHGSPIFIDDVCTDCQYSEFAKKIKTEAIDEFYNRLLAYKKDINLANYPWNYIELVTKQLKENQK